MSSEYSGYKYSQSVPWTTAGLVCPNGILLGRLDGGGESVSDSTKVSEYRKDGAGNSAPRL